MSKCVLITGGAGFIGSHLADDLLSRGYRVRVLDALRAQVHGDSGARPAYLSEDVELIVGDVRDRDAVRSALKGVEAVYHFAASVGVGQSMYEIAAYTQTNNVGTAVLLEQVIAHPVERLIVASSMSVYGEGLYLSTEGTPVTGERSREQFTAGQWEVRGPDGEELTPVATPETKPPALSSIYALSKYDQERMSLMVGEAYAIPTVALRFFNVYGTRQALSNPYTGVLAIFASRLLNGNPPMIFEDGLQQRDFVHVRDVCQACRLALDAETATGKAINVGSGNRYTVLEVAERMAAVLGRDFIDPQVTGRYRVGDIRNCFADVTLAGEVLGYRPEVDFDAGLAELAAWLDGQRADDLVDRASSELATRGLTV
jgi:dTDP-L-rhamnose 4-epimerase